MFAMTTIKVASKRVACFFLFLFLLALSCTSEDPEAIDRERARRQQEQNKSAVRTTANQVVYGQYNSSDYKGSSCEDAEDNDKEIDNEDCDDICDRMYDQESDKCEALSVDLIKKLARLFKDMSRVGNEENLSRTVSSFDFGVMIDIDVEPALNLIEQWNIREVAEFLIWTAKTPAITLALENHDEDHQILKQAFEAVSDEHSVEKGLAKDLKGFGKTFWALAQAERNKSAFIVIHSLLQDICSDKSCKMKHYCIRDEFENVRRQNTCPYSGSRRSFRRVEHCYIHGPNVWNYWLSLHGDDEFNDSDFPTSTKMNEEECDKLCQTESCQRN